METGEAQMMRPIEKVLSRLKHKRIGPGKYLAFAPTRSERTPSVSIKELEDGGLLLHDFGGDSTADILTAIGLNLADLFPERPSSHQARRPVNRAFFPSDVFEIARQEIGVAAIVAADLVKKREVTEQDYARLLEASVRLGRIAEAAYGR